MEHPATPKENGTPEEPVGIQAGAWVPPIRELVPSIIGGAVVPFVVYFLVRRHVSSDTTALIIAGLFPAAWVIIQFVRQRRLDPIGLVVLLGFATGVTASELLGGNAYVLKAKDSAVTATFGLACLVSLVAAKRPVMFYVGRYLAAGNDPVRVVAYDRLHDAPTGQRIFKVLTFVWGCGLLIEASTRLVLAGVVSTGLFLAISPVITGVFVGGMLLFTVRYANAGRRLGKPPH